LELYSVFSSVFFHVGSVVSISIGISEILVENHKFLVPHLYLAPYVEDDPVGISEFGKLE